MRLARVGGRPAWKPDRRGVRGLLAPEPNRLQIIDALRLDHCVIAVSGWDRSNAFYRDVLGAELVELSYGRWGYRFGSQQLNVHGPGSEPHPRAADPVHPGNSDLCFVWDGPIEGAVEHLAAHGVDVEVGPTERSGAGGTGMSVYFRDPDGSLLELISYGS